MAPNESRTYIEYHSDGVPLAGLLEFKKPQRREMKDLKIVFMDASGMEMEMKMDGPIEFTMTPLEPVEWLADILEGMEFKTIDQVSPTFTNGELSPWAINEDWD